MSFSRAHASLPNLRIPNGMVGKIVALAALVCFELSAVEGNVSSQEDVIIDPLEEPRGHLGSHVYLLQHEVKLAETAPNKAGRSYLTKHTVHKKQKQSLLGGLPRPRITID